MAILELLFNPSFSLLVPLSLGQRRVSAQLRPQSWTNTTYGTKGLELLENGLTAQQALDQLAAADDGRSQRQVGMIDVKGNVAHYTGDECLGWAGCAQRRKLLGTRQLTDRRSGGRCDGEGI